MIVTNASSLSAKKIVILDRDGVINLDSPDYIKTAAEWIPIPGSIEAIARVSRAGYHVVIATNQSGLGRGLFDEDDLAQIHHKLRYMVEEAGGAIEGIYYCPHLPSDGCTCRKPATGLLSQIEQEMNSKLSDCWFIGDSEKDVEAARAYGCLPALVKTGNGIMAASTLNLPGLEPVPVFDDLANAIDQLYFSNHV